MKIKSMNNLGKTFQEIRSFSDLFKSVNWTPTKNCGATEIAQAITHKTRVCVCVPKCSLIKDSKPFVQQPRQLHLDLCI